MASRAFHGHRRHRLDAHEATGFQLRTPHAPTWTDAERVHDYHCDDDADELVALSGPFEAPDTLRSFWETRQDRSARALGKPSAAAMEAEASPAATLLPLPTIDALLGDTSSRNEWITTTSPDDAGRARRTTTLSRALSPPARHLTTAPHGPAKSLHRHVTTRRRRSSAQEPSSSPVTKTQIATPTATSPSSSARSSPPPSPSPPASTAKRPRYLCDVDRRSIIRRIDNGEKQAALAREFGVTRAAICHIKKNRDEIVARYESLLASATDLEQATITPSNSPSGAHASSCVHELAHRVVPMLLTTLRDATTSPRAFRAAADRLMTVLLEEAIATSTSTVVCDVQTTSGQTVRGVRPTADVCGVSVGHKGRPLANVFHQLQPEQAMVGHVHLRSERLHLDGDVVRPFVESVDLPRDMSLEAGVVLLLTSSMATGQSVCAVIEALLDTGVAEDAIRVAALACTSRAVERITNRFPGVTVMACAVEASPATTLSDFVERYTAVGNQHSHAWR